MWISIFYVNFQESISSPIHSSQCTWWSLKKMSAFMVPLFKTHQWLSISLKTKTNRACRICLNLPPPSSSLLSSPSVPPPLLDLCISHTHHFFPISQTPQALLLLRAFAHTLSTSWNLFLSTPRSAFFTWLPFALLFQVLGYTVISSVGSPLML